MSGKWILESVKNNPTFEKGHSVHQRTAYARLRTRKQESDIFIHAAIQLVTQSGTIILQNGKN